MRQIYKALAAQCSGTDTVLGYYTGHVDDITAYCKANHNLGYGLSLVPINPISIPDDYADKYDILNKRKLQLEQELASLNKQIQSI